MRWLLGVLMLVLCLGTPAMAGKVDTADALEKQAAKLGPNPTEPGAELHTKLLCLCHFGAASAIVGFVTANSTTVLPVGQQEVIADCLVPLYADTTTGELLNSDTCANSLGTSWELVK